MFYYLKGILAYTEPYFAVIDCGGVGYKLTVSGSTYDAVSDKIGTEVKLYTNLQVREDNVELFGFASHDESNIFKMLIGVSGVGPKAAMSVLTQMTPSNFSYAVCTEDVKAIAKAPGIGAKTASRIVLELKDKFAKEYLGGTDGDASFARVSGGDAKQSGALGDATEALMSLGYVKSEILTALRGVDTSAMTVEQIITEALKKFV